MIRRTMLALLGSAFGSAAISPARALRGDRAAGTSQPVEIDWAKHLARHDLIWDRVPKTWDASAFLGNGMLGAMLYQDAETGLLRVDVGRADVNDHRKPLKEGNFDNARLPIGHFLLRTKGRLRDACALRLSLRDATVSGEISTDHGTIAIRAYVHAVDMAIVVNARGTGGEIDASWDFVGEQADSPRQTFGITAKQPTRVLKGYQSNPAGQRTTDATEQLWLQPLSAGGLTATAWRTSGSRLIASVAHSFPGTRAREEALTAVRRFSADPTAEQRHITWWREFYPASFVSVPDTRIESFYWIQLYKLASATRADRALIDNQGPWLQPTPWPSAWWNLNVQLTYWAPLASNHADLAQSLVGALKRNATQLAANVAPAYQHDSASISRTSAADLDGPIAPPVMGTTAAVEMTGMASVGRAPEVGNLPWALHNVWLVWRHTMDEAVLRDTLFPLLRRTTNYYRHFLAKGADSKLHLPVTYSPELAAAPDLNYDLALLRWSCVALIEAAKRLDITDPLLPEWRRILLELVDYPTDANGYMIGAGQPLKVSHRHYSHLLMAYPLYLVNADQPNAEALVQRSVDHWQSMPARLQGYSSTGASSLASAFGKGDAALKHLHALFTSFLRPNTLYKEDGPVIETPLSGAQSLLDMLIQSWGNTIRPFPAVPSAWPDCSFADLSAEGGFLVSGQRAGGTTRWIKVVSRAGEPFRIKTDIADPVARVNGKPRLLTITSDGKLTADLARGETILLFPRGTAPRTVVRPVAGHGPINSFGLNPRNSSVLKKDTNLPEQ